MTIKLSKGGEMKQTVEITTQLPGREDRIEIYPDAKIIINHDTQGILIITGKASGRRKESIYLPYSMIKRVEAKDENGQTRYTCNDIFLLWIAIDMYEVVLEATEC